MDWTTPKQELGGLSPDDFVVRQWASLKETASPIRAIANDLALRLGEEVTYDAVQKRIRATRTTVAERGDFRKHWNLLCELIRRDPSKELPKAKVAKEKRLVAVLCDTHGDPNKKIIADLIHRKPQIVSFNGDVFDAVQFSRFTRLNAKPITDEIASVRAAVELIVEKTGAEIYLSSGNHDDRVRKYFEARVEPQFMPLVKYNLLELLAFGMEESVHVVSTAYPMRDSTLTAAFFHILGDAVIGHAEAARKGEMRTVDIFADWLDMWRLPLQLPEPKLIVQAHVHRAGISYPRGGHQVRVEGGYSGNVSALQYSMDGSIKYTPPVIGYTLFEQVFDRGLWKTILPSVKFVMM